MENKYKIADFFKGYASGGHPSPEFWLETHVFPYIPKNIKTIVDFGCANGRNLSILKYKIISLKF